MPNPGKKSGLFAPLVLIASCIAMGWFFFWLIETRVNTGDSYPEYSSHRADPLGTKALYLAIDAMPGRKSERVETAWHRYRPDEPFTLMCLGTADNLYYLEEKEKKTLLGWLEAGNRVVITLSRRSYFNADREDELKKEESEKTDENPDESQEKDEQSASILDEDGLFGLTSVVFVGKLGEKSFDLETTDFPSTRWRGSYSLKFDTESPWEVLGRVDDKPMLVRRKIGSGEILVYTDSSFATNEMMRNQRDSAFALAMIGSSPLVAFDERLHGSRVDPGIMTLMRTMNMHGMVAGGLLVIALLVWQGMVPLVPRRDEDEEITEEDTGYDSSVGLRNLLERAITPTSILHECLKRWTKSSTINKKPSADAMEKATQSAKNAHVGNLANAYNNIRDIFKIH